MLIGYKMGTIGFLETFHKEITKIMLIYNLEISIMIIAMGYAGVSDAYKELLRNRQITVHRLFSTVPDQKSEIGNQET